MGGMMTITGGRPLYGTVKVPAAKNSVLPLLAANVLCEGKVTLRNIPRLSDVEDCLLLLRSIGCTGRWNGEDIVAGGPPTACRLPEREMARMRASILFAAPVLARMGRVEATLPGGCRIGARPIDMHLDGLRQMGAQLETAGERLILTAHGGLHGTEYALAFPSVGATETMLLAAVTARGDTVLHGAAQEPEIGDLARFLNECGGCIEGAGTPEIRIHGRRFLGGTAYRPLPDRIFAATIACAVAAARGAVRIEGCEAKLYAPLLAALARMGCAVAESGKASVTVSRSGILRGVGEVCTGVYPGFATDAAPLLAACALHAQGESRIEDKIFENRFGCTEGFARLGARVGLEQNGRVLHIRQAAALRGTTLHAADLRGGAALAVAALGAKGTSHILGCEYIERGYAALGDTLAGLGAEIG